MADSRDGVGDFELLNKICGKKVTRGCSFAGLLLVCGSAGATWGQQAIVDTDRDGMSDATEQRLLERFAPRFRLSAGECDEAPAEFEAGTVKATTIARNGTIYGQVTPRGVDGQGRALVEVHFYDLWAKDCGRNGHTLDAEHVSALLEADGTTAQAEAWRAVYWFAAAHEATMCDMSQVATGTALRAETNGPEVWISAGKHAAYLAEEICEGGCGADRCAGSEPMKRARVVNLGEPGAPMNGAVWVADSRWPMRVKMETDFPPAALARLRVREMGEPVQSNGAHASVKSSIYVANATYDGLATSAARTSGALGTADDATAGALDDSRQKTSEALGRSAANTGKALGKSVTGVGRALRKTAGAVLAAETRDGKDAAK